MLDIVDGLSLNDVLLLPKFSDLKSRSLVDLSVSFAKGFEFSLPFVPSNMATISELAMAKVFCDRKGLAILHRFAPFEQQLEWLEEVKTWKNGTRHVGFSIGVKDEDYDNVYKLINKGAEIILIDIAHGWSAHCIDMIKYISKSYPHVLLIAGNVASGKGAEALWMAGADVVKANVGSGSLCSTRIRTGCGAPSIFTLHSCADMKRILEERTKRKLGLMQDGGAVDSGGVAKTLALADMYMGGNIFAGTDETPGPIVTKDGKKFKSYVGSSTHKVTYKEGIETLKQYRGSVQPIIEEIIEGIKSCCSYNGAKNLAELRRHPQWIKISASGYAESKPHDYDVLIK